VLNTRHDLSLGEAVEAPLRGIERAQRDHGIVSRLIICALRNLSPGISLELARLAVAYKDRGVAGFDLAGGERGHPASVHAEAFAHAREHGLACTCHAGEGAGADSVREAVYACGAQRLGHATHLIEDLALTDLVNERGITLELCLTSNVQTRAAASYETHPMRRYFDKGMNIVLNTDNRLMSGTTLTDEYAHAAEHLDFSFDELCKVALNGFESAFLPAAQREVLIARAKSDIAALGGVA
jgi:adenosine deaminase